MEILIKKYAEQSAQHINFKLWKFISRKKQILFHELQSL